MSGKDSKDPREPETFGLPAAFRDPLSEHMRSMVIGNVTRTHPLRIPLKVVKDEVTCITYQVEESESLARVDTVIGELQLAPATFGGDLAAVVNPLDWVSVSFRGYTWRIGSPQFWELSLDKRFVETKLRPMNVACGMRFPTVSLWIESPGKQLDTPPHVQLVGYEVEVIR